MLTPQCTVGLPPHRENEAFWSGASWGAKITPYLRSKACSAPWLLFMYELPRRFSRSRIAVWLQLEKRGAVAVKNQVYLLPNSQQARKDLSAVTRNIVARKGRASVFAAQSLDRLSRAEAIARFRRARRNEYEALRSAAKWTLRLWTASPHANPIERRVRLVRLFGERLARIEAIDFFRADGRTEAAAALTALKRFVKSMSVCRR